MRAPISNLSHIRARNMGSATQPLMRAVRSSREQYRLQCPGGYRVLEGTEGSARKRVSPRFQVNSGAGVLESSRWERS